MSLFSKPVAKKKPPINNDILIKIQNKTRITAKTMIIFCLCIHAFFKKGLLKYNLHTLNLPF